MGVNLTDYSTGEQVNTSLLLADSSLQTLDIDTKKVIVTTFTDVGINDAIDLLGLSGGEVYLPEGEYAINGEITIDVDNTSLRGAGKGTILRVDDTSAVTKIINVTGKNGISLKDFAIDGNRTNNTSEQYGIYLENCSDINILNLKICEINGGTATAGGDGIYGDTTSKPIEVNINGCLIDGCDDDGIDNIGNRARIISNEIENCGDNGIDTEGATYSVFSGNIIHDCAGAAIELEDEGIAVAEYNVVTGNTIYNTTKAVSIGIRIHSAENNSVLGNVISNCLTGISLAKANPAFGATYNTLSSNVIKDCTNGIKETAGEADWNTYIGNTITNATSAYDINGANSGVLLNQGENIGVRGGFAALGTVAGNDLLGAPTGDKPSLILNKGTGTSTDIMQVFANNGTDLLFAVQYDGRLYVASDNANPSIVAGPGAGSGPAVTITGTDSAGFISITIGSAPTGSASNIFQVNFSRAFNNKPSVVLTPANQNATNIVANQARSPFVPETTTTYFQLTSNDSELFAAVTYQWHYQVLGT